MIGEGKAMTQDIRWIHRLDNFIKAYRQLEKGIKKAKDENLTDLEKEGVIQRFEYTFELAWKTLSDKMIEDGLTIERISPKYVFKLAYQSKYIDDIDTWINMANDRNLMSHTYDLSTFDSVLVRLQNEYFPLLQKLSTFFVEERTNGLWPE